MAKLLIQGCLGTGTIWGKIRKLCKPQIFLVILVILEFHLKGFAH